MDTKTSQSAIQRLPIEILVIVIASSSTLQDVVRWRLLSKAWRDLFDSSEEQILFLACMNQGYYAATTCGAGANSVDKLQGFDLLRPTASTAKQYLTNVTMGQATMCDIYRNCQSWKQYLKRHRAVANNWKNGRCGDAVAFTEPGFEAWRFKLDSSSDKRFFVVSARPGSLVVSKPYPGDEVEDNMFDTGRSFPHVEYTDGYIITTVQDTFSIWKHSPIPSPSSKTLQFEAESGTTQQFFSIHNIEPPMACHAFKARAPFLIGGANTGPGPSKLFVWRVEDGVMQVELDVLPRIFMEGILYVEVDDHWGYLASTGCISVYSLDGSQHTTVLPPLALPQATWTLQGSAVVSAPAGFTVAPAPSTIPNTFESNFEEKPVLAPLHGPSGALGLGEDREPLPQPLWECSWNALHHDGKGGHFLAISPTGYLLWTPRIWTVLSAPAADQWKHFVSVDLCGDPTNLCVENGRALVTLRSRTGNFESLLALELRDWTDFDDFARDPPKLATVSGAMPASSPISRMEMDATSCYFTGDSTWIELAADREVLVELAEAHETKWAEVWMKRRVWKALNGSELGGAWKGSGVSSPELNLDDLVEEWQGMAAGGINNSIIEFDFTDGVEVGVRGALRGA